MRKIITFFIFTKKLKEKTVEYILGLYFITYLKTILMQSLKNIFSICLLFCSLQGLYAQALYSDVQDFEIIKDKKQRKQLEKKWKQAVKGSKAFYVLGESQSYIFITISDKDITINELLNIQAPPNQKEWTIKFNGFNENYSQFSNCYAFDKKNFQLKFAYQLKLKLLSSSSPKIVDYYIDYENDDLHLFYRTRKKTSIQYLHQLNANAPQVLTELSCSVEKTGSPSPSLPSLTTSFSEEHILIGVTEDEQLYTAYIYSKAMKLLETHQIKLPTKALQKPESSLEMEAQNRLRTLFCLNYNVKANTIYLQGVDNEDKHHPNLNIFEYDTKTKNVINHKIDVKLLGFKENKKVGGLFSSTFYPTLNCFFKDDFFYILGVQPLEEDGKYEKIAGQIVFHKLNLNFKVLSLDIMKIPVSAWKDFDDKQSYFKRKKSGYSIAISHRNNQLFIELNVLSPMAELNMTANTSIYNTEIKYAGKLIFPVSEDKIQTPFLFHTKFGKEYYSRKELDGYYFYFEGRKLYLNTRNKFRLYEIKNDKKDLIVETNIDQKLRHKVRHGFIYCSLNYGLFTTEQGIVRINF